MKQKKPWISLFVFLLLCFLVASVGSLWTKEGVTTWYSTLIKPSWTPPAWVFGPVWSILYAMIAVSGWLIYQANHSRQRIVALIFYSIQLFLNFIWSFLFFSLRSPILGFIDILLLCVFIALTIIQAWRVRPLASILLIPYLLWVMYATTINAGIWILNKG